MSASVEWGLLPDRVYHTIYQKEWSSFRAIKRRMLGKKGFPLRMSLKPPSGAQALTNITHFQHYISQWNVFEYPHLVEKELRHYRDIGDQLIPKSLVIHSMKALIDYLGAEAIDRSHDWQVKMQPLLAIDQNLSTACINELETLEKMSVLECQLLSLTLKQMLPGMGKGLYLRAIPISGVDTKFIETYETLITGCLDILFSHDVSDQGGLLNWLDCEPKPKGWILVRPLCETTRHALGGIPLLKMAQDDLATFDFPAQNIIVVENDASGLSLPELPNTIAVFGGGGNVSWMKSVHLTHKRMFYWGDIDSYGFKYLSDARSLCPHVESVMMDEKTVLEFEERMTEDSLYLGEMAHLTHAENALCQELRNGKFKQTRLEQERIAQDRINSIFSRTLAI